MARSQTPDKKGRSRYGIGEWYGYLFAATTSAMRRKFARLQALPKRKRPAQPCPFKVPDAKDKSCTKIGGVCSLRLYQIDPRTHRVGPAHGNLGSLVTTCPNRFQENGVIFEWVGKTLLGSPNPIVVGQVGFLEREGSEQTQETTKGEDVGRIDNVLVHPASSTLQWCAMELQSVYFSGGEMGQEFAALKNVKSEDIPFPVAQRRPDYRSSGPKRLMPQLQVKVPALRRWGKKMAVVIDRKFFDALGVMDNVRHVSNCDIAWFVVKYELTSGKAVLKPDFVRLTTLERAVEGLTGGRPVSLDEFEARIRDKLPEKIRAGAAI